MIIKPRKNVASSICNWDPQQLIQENNHFDSSKCQLAKHGLHQKFKAYILINLNKKIGRCRIECIYSKNEAINIWLAKTTLPIRRRQANQKVLTCQPISQFCFFYRIKIFCNHIQNYNKISPSDCKNNQIPYQVQTNLKGLELQQFSLKKIDSFQKQRSDQTALQGKKLSNLQKRIFDLRTRTMWLILTKIGERIKQSLLKEFMQKG